MANLCIWCYCPMLRRYRLIFGNLGAIINTQKDSLQYRTKRKEYHDISALSARISLSVLSQKYTELSVYPQLIRSSITCHYSPLCKVIIIQTAIGNIRACQTLKRQVLLISNYNSSKFLGTSQDHQALLLYR